MQPETAKPARYKVYSEPKGTNAFTGTSYDNLSRAKKHAINEARAKPGSVFGVRGAGGQLLGTFGPYANKGQKR